MSDYVFKQKPYLLNPKHKGWLDGTAHEYLEAPLWFGVVMIVFLLIGILVGLGISYYGFQEYQTQQRLGREGLTASAAVTNLSTSSSSKSRSYYVTYEFTANEKTYSYTQSVGSDFYNQLSQGASVQIIYLPSNPATSRLANSQSSSAPLILMVIGLVLVVIEFVIVWVVLSRIQRGSQLSKEGQVMLGEILNEKGAIRRQGKASYAIKYKFRNPLGVELQGKALFSNRSRTKVRAVGLQITSPLNQRSLPLEGDVVAVVYVNDSLYDLL